MSETLETFATLTFPFGSYGAGIQLQKNNGQNKIHGSAGRWQTYVSILLWAGELTCLVLAAIFSVMLDMDVKHVDDPAIVGNGHFADRLHTSLLLNSIAFCIRACAVALVVLTNLTTCGVPGCARAVADFFFMGNVWSSGRQSGTRTSCIMIWWFIGQLTFLLPMITLMILVLGNDIGTVLAKSCLQLGMEECSWECAFKYSPFTSFDSAYGHTFTKPITTLYTLSYLLYFGAAFVRIFRNTVLFLCVRTIVGNNPLSHNTVGDDQRVVQTAVDATLASSIGFAKNKNLQEVTYGFETDGIRKRGGGPVRFDLI